MPPFVQLVLWIVLVLVGLWLAGWAVLWLGGALWRRWRRPRLTVVGSDLTEEGRGTIVRPPAKRQDGLPMLAWQAPPITPTPMQKLTPREDETD